MKNVRAGTVLNYVFITLVGFITLYPFIYILSASVSPPTSLVNGRVVLLPKGFSLAAYEVVFMDKRLIMGVFNSIKYTLAGTAISVLFTTLTAYPLAQPKFKKYARHYMKFVVFTMLFSGGLIPTYLVIRSLGLVNTFWVMVIPWAISPFYLILVRTFMQQLPMELFEAAEIEGCGDLDMYIRIVLPLCMPIIACISLYYAVGTWNAYMNPLIYLTSESKYPLQIFLRQLILMSAMQEMEMAASGSETLILGATYNSESIKSATLVVSTIPILIAYPFLQKYFVKGVMVGAIKG
ncbi:protein LplC [Spirochaetia bacterium]|nr:protein LplC [Spirochaetia bacterium]